MHDEFQRTHTRAERLQYMHEKYACVFAVRTTIHNDQHSVRKIYRCIVLHGCFLSVGKRSYIMKI